MKIKIIASRFAAITLGILLSAQAFSEIAVIVHPDNKTTLGEEEIKRLYLMKDKYFPNGSPVKIFNLAGEAQAKNEFYTKVLNKEEARLNSLWARVLFSSAASPPADVDSATSMKAAIAKNPTAIGFIDAKDVDDSVRVILRK